MKQTAIDIRAQLKEAGYPSRSVSVRCRPNYQIHVSAPEVNTKKLCATVMEAYHRRPHHWLVVCVNNHYLPMPPINNPNPITPPRR